MPDFNYEAQRRNALGLAITCVIVPVAFYLVDDDPDPAGYLFAAGVLGGAVYVGVLLVRRLR